MDESDRWSESNYDSCSTSSSSSCNSRSRYYIEDEAEKDFFYTHSQGSQVNNLATMSTNSNKSYLDEMIQKRKKKRWKAICTTACRYEIVRHVIHQMGFTEAGETDPWIIYWTDSSVPFEKLLDMKRYQKVNHFPGMNELCRKDLLARNLKRMLKIFPKDYNIFPRTWCLPADFSDLLKFVGKKKKTLICKPETGCQGKGIFITRSIKTLNPVEKLVTQHYITKPFLIDGYKFDLRLYVLMTAVDPEYRIYVYKEGLARFATVKYERPNGRNINNMFMHLTNYAVNKHSNYFVHDDAAGSKRKLSSVNEWWKNHGYNAVEIWKKIDDAIIKTLISASDTLKHNYRTCFPNHIGANACFEILGFDVILDHNLNPFVLEVNLSPSYHVDSLLDKEVKEGLIRNTFELLNIEQCNPKRCAEEDRKKARTRLLHSLRKPENSNVVKDQLKAEQQELANESISSTELYELQHIGNYRLIYPIHSYTHIYEKYFDTNVTMYQETASSRARGEHTRNQRSELTKAKASKTDKPVEKKKRVQSRLPKLTSAQAGKRKYFVYGESTSNETTKLTSSSSSSPGESTWDNWQPMPIDFNGRDEMERVKALIQREQLIRNSGIVETINQIMGNEKKAFLNEPKVRLYIDFNKPLRYSPYKAQISQNINNLLSSAKRQKCCAHTGLEDDLSQYRLGAASAQTTGLVTTKIPQNCVQWPPYFIPKEFVLRQPMVQRPYSSKSQCLAHQSPLVKTRTTSKSTSDICSHVRVTRAFLARTESNLAKIDKMNAVNRRKYQAR